MTYALIWLPEVLEGAGLKVAEVPGWRTRGRGEMGEVRGVICHHTGVRSTSNMPTLQVLIEGRPAAATQLALPGPLAQLGLARDGTFYVVAAGRANHAGPGAWEGCITGNLSFIGIEAENSGYPDDPWPEVQVDAYQRGVAALLTKIGAGARMCCGHKEWAPGRKPDPDFDMPVFRRAVADYIDGRTPPPLIPAYDASGRLTVRRGQRGELVRQIQQKLQVGADGLFGASTEAAVREFQRAKTLVPDGIVGPKTWAALNGVPKSSADGLSRAGTQDNADKGG